MRCVLLGCLLALAVASAPAIAQKKKPAAKAPPKIAAQLKPWLDRLKKTTDPELKEHKNGGYFLSREVAGDVRYSAEVSDFADRPYVAKIHWTSKHQETKIYSEKEQAEKSKEWLRLGRIAGTDAGKVPLLFTTVLYYENQKWSIDSMSWIADRRGAGGPPVKLHTIKDGNTEKQPWWEAMSIVGDATKAKK